MANNKKIFIIGSIILYTLLAFAFLAPKASAYIRGDISRCVDETTITNPANDGPPVDLNTWNRDFCASHQGYDPIGSSRCDNGDFFGDAPQAIDPVVYCTERGSRYSYVSPGTTGTTPAAKVPVDCEEADLNRSNCKIIDIVLKITNAMSALVGVVIIIMIIIGGIQYSMSGGKGGGQNSPAASVAAKKRIYNAIIALILFMFMYAFLQWVVPGGIF